MRTNNSSCDCTLVICMCPLVKNTKDIIIISFLGKSVFLLLLHLREPVVLGGSLSGKTPAPPPSPPSSIPLSPTSEPLAGKPI